MTPRPRLLCVTLSSNKTVKNLTVKVLNILRILMEELKLRIQNGVDLFQSLST